MKKLAPKIARYVLGLAFFIFGGAGLFNLFPAPPVMLVILAPITIQIFLLHTFLTPGLTNLILPAILIVAHVTAAMGYWHLYRPLFNRYSN